jgi:flagellar hook protein FlgE
MLSNSITSSMLGIRQHIDMLDEHARKFQDAEDADIAEAAVGMIVAQRGFEANVGALRVSLDMQKSIIDILA